MVHKKKLKPKIMFAIGGINVTPQKFHKEVEKIMSKVHVTSAYEIELTESGKLKKKKKLM